MERIEIRKCKPSEFIKVSEFLNKHTQNQITKPIFNNMIVCLVGGEIVSTIGYEKGLDVGLLRFALFKRKYIEYFKLMFSLLVEEAVNEGINEFLVILIKDTVDSQDSLFTDLGFEFVNKCTLGNRYKYYF